MADAETAAARLECCFEAIRRERMHDVPILNPALEVRALGSRRFGACWLSVLVTPWFINVMLLPAEDAEADRWAALKIGESVKHVLPAGRFAFIVGEEAGLGRFQMCSLFSPVLEFEDQAAALAAAEAALAALFEPQEEEIAPEEQAFMGALSRGELPAELAAPEADPAEPDGGEPGGGDPGGGDPAEPATPSRRALLTGTLSREEAEGR